MTVTERRDDQGLFEFYAPGFVHGLGNSLFTIRGAAQIMSDGGPSCSKQRQAILRACEQADHQLALLRWFDRDAIARGGEQAGVVLTRFAALARVPLRDHGLRIECSHSSTERPAVVDPIRTVRGVGEVLRAVAESAPAGYCGVLSIDLESQDRRRVIVRVLLRPDESFLPFPPEWERIRAAVGPRLAVLGVTLDGPDDEGAVRVALPVAAP